ncbi:MAG: hypothetical protein CL398_03075 [Acidiferrobacteraceae bacterium]|nr:hypothetical protein [Acidiferrobacteraceae bacterium]
MWAKRFVLPDFDYEGLKDLEWSSPALISEDEAIHRAKSASSDSRSEIGVFPVQASDALYERFDIKGVYRHAVLCVTPQEKVTLLGKSHAWKKQRLLILDSIEIENAQVLMDWKTARPMSTRLGPIDGVQLPGGSWYVIVSHMIGNHFVGNRTLLSSISQEDQKANGLSIMSSSEPEFNDFHDCNLYITWSGN